MVLSLALAFVVVAADPADLSIPGPAAPSNALLRVVVLHAKTRDLDADEAALLASLVAMRLEKNQSFDVVSEGALDDVASRCSDVSCMPDAAASSHADFVLLAETGPLGDALVLTLHAYAADRRRFVRDAISTHQRGELPEKIGGLVDSVILPLMSSLPVVRRPDVRERFEQARLEICNGNGGGWFFCDHLHHAITENEFIRRYRAETARHDLDVALIDRAPSLEPWWFLIAGGAAAVVTVGATVVVGNTTAGEAFARQSDDAWIVLPVLGLTASLGLIVYGAIELDDTPTIHDGTELDHMLEQGTADAAVRAYDDAVLARIERDVGAG